MSCWSMPLSPFLFLSANHGGRVHDLRIAGATPYPLPAGSQLLQDLGFWRSRSLRWRSSCPRRNHRGRSSRWNSKWPIRCCTVVGCGLSMFNSSVKCCRIVKDRIRLWQEGVRDLVMELCLCPAQLRVRLTPWQLMI